MTVSFSTRLLLLQKPMLRAVANRFETLTTMEASMSNAKKVVLVIEDNLWVQEILYSMLSSEYQLVIRSNGVEGVETLDAMGESIFAVITDAEMPMMNGDEVIDWIRSKHRDLPVLLMTCGSERIDLERTLAKPNVLLLKKPFHKSEVREKLGRCALVVPKAA
jgi:CheY-like chemotaxis protein